MKNAECLGCGLVRREACSSGAAWPGLAGASLFYWKWWDPLLAEGSRGRYSPPGRGEQGEIFSSWQRGAGGDTLQHNQVRIFTVKAWSISVRPSISFMNLDFVVRIPSPAPPPPGRLTPPPRPPAAAAAPPAAARATRGTQKQVSGCPQTGGRQHRNIA